MTLHDMVNENLNEWELKSIFILLKLKERPTYSPDVQLHWYFVKSSLDFMKAEFTVDTHEGHEVFLAAQIWVWA